MAELEKSWYTKYRPNTMNEYSGDRIRQQIKARFRVEKEFPHVIMVHGPRGCGKTTLDRLLCGYYQCENRNEDGTPCGKCDACIELKETLIYAEPGVQTPGVTEIDSTSASGKEAIQEVLNDAVIAPVYNKYKIIIFDECHAISSAAQNSMLKILEDIPSHLVVIFSTTEYNKVINTIKSRCQLIIEVKPQTLDDMVDRLMYISKCENLTVTKDALEMIAKKEHRMPRECINRLESVAKTYDREVNIKNVKEIYNDCINELYIKFFEASNKSLEDILQVNMELDKNDITVNKFINGLMEFALDSMYIKHGLKLDEYTTDYIKNVKRLFNVYTSQDFDALLQVLEYASNSVTANEEAKNNVLLITTAMRIGKIDLIANGLSSERDKAVVENNISMAEYANNLKNNRVQTTEKLKMSLTPSLIKDTFEDAEVITGEENLMSEISRISLNNKNAEDEDEEGIDENNIVDDFFENNKN